MDRPADRPTHHLGAIKRLLPSGSKARTLPIGLGRGLKFGINFAHQSRLYLGTYEWELTGFIREIARPGYITFDVGGHSGYDALVFAKLTDAPVVTFEPDPRVLPGLRSNVEANPRYRDKIRVVEAFVGATKSETTTTVDDVAYSADAPLLPDIIKIDVEGAEEDVLHGAKRVLAERKPHLLIETHAPDLEVKCGRLLVEAGYRPRIKHQRRVLRENRSQSHNRWLLATSPSA
jgi:hypothetical protein